MSRQELLTNEDMSRADRMVIADGTPGIELMEQAGQVCADEIRAAFPDAKRIAVLCGPGNNGGDGFVIARLLQEAGLEVQLGLLGSLDKLKGDAAQAAERWDGKIGLMTTAVLKGADLVVDAIFGAGLSRPLDGVPARMIAELKSGQVPVVAVDVPSGVDGNTGQIRGAAFMADLTVSFFRGKPGHYLMPGREMCGRVVVRDIGIGETVLEGICPSISLNSPELWKGAFPRPGRQGHKYSRGHTVVLSGPFGRSGAARLAARGALRAGAGLVTVAAPPSALSECAAQLTAIMLRLVDSDDALEVLLSDRRRNVVVAGPGHGGGGYTRAHVEVVLKSGAATILDADALTAYEGRAKELISLIRLRKSRPVILTPHEGEYARLFKGMGVITESSSEVVESKCERAVRAAHASGAYVVFKGPDTVIAAPDGRVVINANAPATLATAGSGDVLSGIIAGLLAQGMAPMMAACSAVWLHGAAASNIGPGLIAEDIPEALPAVLRQLEIG